MSAQLDIHWSALLPELEAPADEPARILKRRYETAEKRAVERAETEASQAEVVRIDYLRRRRLFVAMRRRS